MEIKDIEKFFLNNLLRTALGGVFLIFMADLILYPEDTLSLTIDFVIFSTCILSYIVKDKHQNTSVLILTTVILAAMIYQCLVVPANTTTSLSILLIVGFITSVMLKGIVMWIMHGVTFTSINFIFVYQYLNPELRFSQQTNDVVTVAITYTILYFILTYAAGMLKRSYDKINSDLKEKNDELNDKASEINAQNEELLQIQDNLNELNVGLEHIVSERTEKIQHQNEALIRYSYRNAHHLRGPVARLLGLAAIYKLESAPDPDFIIQKMVEQAHEIDAVINEINVDLQASNVVVGNDEDAMKKYE